MDNCTTIPPRVKRCSKCKRELPATIEYFYGDKRVSGGLQHSCKECNGHKFGIYRRNFDGRKTCPACGVSLELSEANFYRHSANATGFDNTCKECNKKSVARWQAANPEKVREYTRRSRQNSLAKRRVYKREWSRANPTKVKEYSRRDLARYAGRRRLSVLNRRARRQSLPDTLTRAQWQRCFEWWNYTCAYCGAQRNFWNVIEADHFIPLDSPSCTGTTALNIVPACRSCNSSKNNNDAAEWLQFKFPRKWRKVLKRIEAYFEWVRQQG